MSRSLDGLDIPTRTILSELYPARSLLVCVSPDSIRVLSPSGEVHPLHRYYAINPPKRVDLLKGLKAHDNMDCLNHFVFESDQLPLEAQLEILEVAQEWIALAVFSGNKSIHIHVVTEYRPESAWNYKFVYQTIADSLFTSSNAGKWDRQCNDPSRLTRIPNGINEKTGKRQTVLHYNPSAVLRRDFQPELLECTELRRTNGRQPVPTGFSERKSNLLSWTPKYRGPADDPEAFIKLANPTTSSYAAGVAILRQEYIPGTAHDALIRGLGALYRFRPYGGEYFYSENFILQLAEQFPRANVQDSLEIAHWIIRRGR